MIDDYLKLNGKHILVTGATSGIGKQTAILLSQLGAKVSVVGRNQERLDEVFLKMDGDGNHKYSFDFKNIDDIESLVKTIVQDGGPLDGLVHSAGITKDLPLANSKNKYVQDIMVTNFNSFIELVRCATKKHRFNEGMSIVGLSSVTANGAAVALSAYAASKAAINGAMRCMARELAPKGTGKSYVFGNLSKFVWLVSGGKVSRAKLVYDKSTKSPGIMRFYDMVAFDEIQTITFSDKSEMQSFLKNYLEYGRATIDNYEFMSECGLMLLGNILLSDNNEPLNYKYFDALPEVFRESALLDRFHGMIEGWLLPRVNVDMALQDWTLNVEFFSEVLHQMRTESIYSQIVDDLIEVPQGADMRHTKAVKRIATAYLKLLFPHITDVGQIDLNEFNMLCLKPAIRRRDIVRQQCSNIDAETSFSKPIPDYKVKGLTNNE